MKKTLNIFLTLASCLLLGACTNNANSNSVGNSEVQSSEVQSSETQFVDYANEFKFDETSSRVREVVTIKDCIDGDTVHFFSNNGFNGVLKARFLGVDTPESTGKVQPWGKKAANFTKTELSAAAEVMIESDTDTWNLDSTGERHMVWVWYRPTAGADWKLLNLNIMQNGLAAAKNITTNSYGEVMSKAYSQAIALKLNYYGGDDPDFPKDEASQITIRELRTNLETYKDSYIRFEGLISRVAGQTAYVESYDPETEFTYGVTVYMGYDNYPMMLKGNIVSVHGYFQYSDLVKSWQVSDLNYIATKPNHAKNTKLISENNEVIPNEITGTEFVEKGDLLQSTNVSIKNLTVNSVYTTDNGGDNDGAMTLTCTSEDGKTVKVRTSVLKKDDDTLVVASDLLNKNITIKEGIMDVFDGDNQIHLFTYNDLLFN